jgi:hypothetical protein
MIEALEGRLLLSVGLLTTDQDIGSPTPPGSASYSNGAYSIIAGGLGIGGNSDQFNFSYEAYSGNVTLVTQVNSLSPNSSASAQAGLMIRNDTSNVSALAAVLVTPSSGIEFVTRTADGGTASQTTVAGISPPRYLELTLSGSIATAYYSSNGTTWTQIGSSPTLTLGATPLVGLAADSANSSLTTTAMFSNLDILPSGWSDNDIGSPPLPGSAGYNPTNNTFTLMGSGSGAGGASDQFNFANYAMTGNGSVTAFVDSLTNTNPSADAGVMIRADTTAASLFAEVDLTAQNTVVFAGRSGSGAFTSSPISVGGPVWLSVTDIGGNFTGYYSTNNINWTQIGTTEAIAMPNATTLAGLWASSNNSSAINTAVFSGVSLLQGGWTDTDIGSPALTGSADYDSPSDTTTISASGAGISGTSDQFNFAGTTMIGNGSAIAYLDSVSNTNALAGVMIRNDSTAGSAFVALLVSPTSGITLEWRSIAGGTTNQQIQSGGPTPAPVGLKLTRAGNTFTAFYSTDGINWIQVGSGELVALNSSALAGLAVTSNNANALSTATFSSVGIGSSPPRGAGIYSSADQLFLNNLEDSEVQYFWDEASPTTGLVPDNANANGGSPSADSSIAAIGFGLSALTIGDARGWLSHANAYQRALTTIDFLFTSGANMNGFFYHFLNSSGGRYGTSEISSVDNAELMAGVLSAAQYWAGTPLQTTALALYDRVNWPWMQQGDGVFYSEWLPGTGSGTGLQGSYGDFSEAALLYLLAMGSPTYPTSVASWYSWSRTPIEKSTGYTFVEADDAALFTEQYPQDWFDLQGLTDNTGLNFYTNSQTATLAQRQFMINLSSTYSDYGPNLWGLTPSEGVSGYTVWGGPPANGPINGTVVPAAAGGSLEFEPRLSIDVLENMAQTYPAEYQKYGLVDAFNPLTNWSSSLDLGIDLGPMLIAAENSRSNLVWNGFMQTSAAQQAVAKAFPSASTDVWAVNGSGNWNVALNWTNGTIPNGVGAVAELLDITPPAQTVYSNSAITEGTLHFNSANEYELTGIGSLTLQATGSNSALVEVDQGTVILDLPITLASNAVFNVAAGATLIIGNPLTINSGITLTQTGGGVVTYESIINVVSGGSIDFAQSTYVQALSLAPGATASLNGNGTILELGNLSSTGTLNLHENTLLINYGSGPDPIASVRASIASGYAGGSWAGPGIMSTAAQANAGSYGLGYADSADPGNPAGLASDTIEIKYTLLGDANLDGTVNSEDFTLFSENLNQSGMMWDDGDFNYDGTVNAEDFTPLSANFNQHSNAAAAMMPIIGAQVVAAPSLGNISSINSNASSSNLLNQPPSNSVSTGVLDPEKKVGHTLRQPVHHPRV